MLFSQVAVFTFTNFSVKSNANQVAALDLKNFLLNQRQKKLQYSIVSRIFPSNQMRIKLQYSISRNFPSNQMQMKLHAGFIYFTNFSVKSDANQVTVFNFTKFSVKSNANEVACWIHLFHEFFRQIRCKSSYVQYSISRNFPFNQMKKKFLDLI